MKMSNNDNPVDYVANEVTNIVGGVGDGLLEIATLGLYQSQSTRDEYKEENALYDSNQNRIGYESNGKIYED